MGWFNAKKRLKGFGGGGIAGPGAVGSGLTFDLPLNNSGASQLPTTLTINGTSVEPDFVYVGQDATTSEWTASTYGETLSIAGSGDLPSVSQDAPFLDGTQAVKFNAGQYYQAGTSSLGALGTRDCVLVLVLNYGTQALNNQPISTSFTTSTTEEGWGFRDVNSTMWFYVSDGSVRSHSTRSYVAEGYNVFVACLDRDATSDQHLQLFCNGVQGSSGNTNLPSATDIGTSLNLTIGDDASTIAYAGMWAADDWFAGGAQNDTDMQSVADEITYKLMGLYPQLAKGTSAPSVATRSSAAYLPVHADKGTELTRPNFYLNFDNTHLSSDDPLDYFGNHDGTTTVGDGVASGKDGYNGQSFYFPGTGVGKVSIASHSDLTFHQKDYSGACWVYPLSGGGGGLGYLWTRRNSYGATINSNGVSGGNMALSMVHDYDSSDLRQVSDYVVPLNEWTHVAWVFDYSSSEFSLYINGSSVSLTTNSSAAGSQGSDSGSEIAIGNDHSFDSRSWDGYIDDFIWYTDYKLTADEIMALADNDWNLGAPNVRYHYVGSNWMRVGSMLETDGTTEAKGYLSEESRTQQLVRTETLADDGYWTTNLASVADGYESIVPGPVVGANVALLYSENGSGLHYVEQTLGAGGNYTSSIFVKQHPDATQDTLTLNSREGLSRGVQIDFSTNTVSVFGAPGDFGGVPMGNGWYWLWVVENGADQVYVRTGGNWNETSGPTPQVYLCAPQLEDSGGDIPTSYIPNTATSGTVSRSKDSLRYVGDDGNLVAPENAFTVDMTQMIIDNDATNVRGFLDVSDGGSSSDRITLLGYQAEAVFAVQSSEGASSVNIDIDAIDYQTGTAIDYRLRYDGSDVVLQDATNDASATDTLAATGPNDLDRIDVGSTRDANNQPCGLVSAIKVWKKDKGAP